jgi:prophage regulatory protein
VNTTLQADQIFQPALAPRLLRIAQVVARTGLSKSTIFRLEAARDFPARLRISKRAIGWREADISHWIEQRRGGCHELHD